MTVKLVTVGRRSTVAAEARVEAIKRQEDEVKAEAAPEDAAADINDELDIQLDEDVSSQLPKHATLNVAIVLHLFALRALLPPGKTCALDCSAMKSCGKDTCCLSATLRKRCPGFCTERWKGGCICRMTSLTYSWTMTVQPQALLKRRLQPLPWTTRHSPSPSSSSRHSRHSSTWSRARTGMCGPGWSSPVRRHPGQRMPCWKRMSRA